MKNEIKKEILDYIYLNCNKMTIETLTYSEIANIIRYIYNVAVQKENTNERTEKDIVKVFEAGAPLKNSLLQKIRVLDE